MRYALFSVALLAGLTLATPSESYVEDLGWASYRNERFGVTLQYPAAIFEREQTSETGDGVLFTTADERAKLLVGALDNLDAHSPRSYQRYIERESYPGLRVDYAPVGHTWAVLSGTRGDTMVYEKVMFSCGGRVINSFAMTYPITERDFYDPIVEEIEDSFRPGAEGCGRHAWQP
jgi:hypothetical protein